MQRDVGGRIPVKSYDESTREGGRETAEMEQTGRGDWTPDLQDVLSGERRTAEMPSGGVPGQSGYEDGNKGELCATSCHQHHGDSGGSKLSPPTVLPVRHASPLADVERAALRHSVVKKGGGTEETTAGGDGDAGEYGASLRGLRGTHQEFDGVYISGESADDG